MHRESGVAAEMQPPLNLPGFQKDNRFDMPAEDPVGAQVSAGRCAAGESRRAQQAARPGLLGGTLRGSPPLVLRTV
jgi:hypothetical protein